MIVTPYVRTPVPPQVALLTPDGVAVSEHGEILDLDAWPASHRLWASYEAVYGLVRAGKGEGLCWNHEEIRWRHRRFEEGWTRRGSDANVVKLPFDDLPPETVLRAFAAWRDWLADCGASPSGTSGSAAWSLLRARLEQPLYTGSGERPPLKFTVGGRQQLGPGGKGSYGGCVLLDLPAAYASTLAGLRYGGSWLEFRDAAAVSVQLSRYGGSDYPVFVRARIRVPGGLLGPLVDRKGRRPQSFLEAQLLADHSGLVGTAYPSGRVIQGVWTFEEVAAAEAAGCKIQKLLACWVHRSGHYPFAPWWESIQVGRRLPGLAGRLAKVTGNALWGRFCMDSTAGVRSIRSRNGELIARPLVGGSQAWPAHDLAETVSGRVRARLYGLMVEAGGSLVSAHTDGAWIKEDDDGSNESRSTGGSGKAPASDEQEGSSRSAVQVMRSGRYSERRGGDQQANPGGPRGATATPDGWRVKQYARRVDLIDPQTLRYWPDPAQPWEPGVVYAGVPAERAAGMFEAAWERQGL